MGLSSFIYHSMGSHEGVLCPSYVKIQIVYAFSTFSYSCNSASHFLEMAMLISKVSTCIMIQIRIRVGSVMFPIMGPMWGQYVFLMTKSIFFMFFFLLSILLCWVIEPHSIK